MDEFKLKEEKVLNIFNSISGNYDAANNRISLGMQKNWKQNLVDAILSIKPEGVLDLCCGTGDIALSLAERGIETTGLDFSDPMLEVAKEKEKAVTGASGIAKPITWVNANAMELPFDDKTFDAVCISFGLRNTPDYAKVLSEMKRVAKRKVFILDSFIPENKFIYPFYKIYFKTLTPFLGGGRRYKKEYEWLFESTDLFLRCGQLEMLVYDTGFVNVSVDKFNFGTCCLLSAECAPV